MKLLLSLFVVVTTLTHAVAASKPPPNIILIVAEDMSAHLGAFGDSVAQTPHLDKLAKSSIRYPNTFTTAGVCAPSRTSLITGVHQITVGGQHMRTRSFEQMPYRAVPPEQIKAFPELMRQHGYYTYVSSKLDYQFSETAANSGPFTIWDYEGKAPDWQRAPKHKPFFGMYHLDITHESQLFPKKIAINKTQGRVKNWIKPEDVNVPSYYPDTAIVRQGIAQHYNNIRAMDSEVGELLAKLKADGLAENTIVIWTTDHGDALPRGKREIYDSGIKVPLIVHWPEQYQPAGFIPGSVNQQLISFVDLAPSILAMANVPVPDFIQGQALLVNERLSPRQFIYASKDRLDEFPFKERAVRSSQFKYIKNYLPNKPGATHLAYRDQMALMQDLWRAFYAGELTPQQSFWFKPRPMEELYNIIDDPEELTNLAANPSYAKELAVMKNALKTWQAKVPDLSDRAELKLAQQFWPNGQQPQTTEPKIIITANGLITIKATMAGSSLGYQISQNNKKQPWQVFNQPLVVKKGMKISAKAIRYGFKESETVTHRF